MRNSGEKIVLVLAAGEFLLGILGNGFMVLVNGIDWVKSKKKLATADLILVLLAISRIGQLCILKWTGLQVMFYLDKLLKNQNKIVGVFWLLSNFSTIWFGTCLSVFYFVKIATFSHPLFLWLKWRINHVLCLLSVGHMLFSLTIYFSLMTKEYVYVINRENTTTFQEFQVNGSEYFLAQAIMNFLSLIPFTLSLVSFFLLIFSLWRHTHQMKLNATGSRDPSTDAHVRAMKSIFSFLILFVLFYLCSVITQWTHMIPNKDLAVKFIIPMMLLYPSGHSLILILYNSKLRQAALKMWWQVRSCLKKKSMT